MHCAEKSCPIPAVEAAEYCLHHGRILTAQRSLTGGCIPLDVMGTDVELLGMNALLRPDYAGIRRRREAARKRKAAQYARKKAAA